MASTSTDGGKRKKEDDNGGETSSPKRGRNAAFDELAPSASTSSSTLIQKPCYDVFINHRGPDVKPTLASTIYNILKKKNVTAFLDSKDLEYSDHFPTILEAVMRSASVHIAIFSKGYAESAWCLAELSFMLNETRAKIVPIFYYVKPTDLRYVAEGKGMYAKAFEEHERKKRYSSKKLQEWKMALHEISFYNGPIIANNDDELCLGKEIKKVVLKAINNMPLVVANHPVGLEKIVKDFETNTLQPGHAAQIVGIWGMGGSGKTTLAKYLYNKKSSSVQRFIFVFGVKDDAAKGVLHNKQIQLLKGLGVKEDHLKFDDIEQGKAFLTRHLRSVKVLIVLDDVDHVDQLDALLPVKDSLENGSLIIVTTRDQIVLRAHGITSVYKMRALDPIYAKELFCQHAFKKSVPPDGFEELVERFLEACNGLPLSLKVSGGQLYGVSDKEYWKDLLNKMLRILPDDIKSKLRISYDALDYEEKEMFLDIACFFIGEEKNLVIEVWNGSGWSGLYSLQKLYNKCLLELDVNNHIILHDHLRDMGREIAKNEHSSYRIWLPEQIINAEKPTERKTGFRGIITAPSILDPLFSKPPKFFERVRTSSSDSAVEELMANTIGSLTSSLGGPKFFVISRDYYNKVICEVSGDLVWLRWFEFQQRSLPTPLLLKKLRVLELYDSHYLEELWMADSDAPVQLRELVISGYNELQRFPNSIGRLNELKKIVITQGFSLTSLPQEFGRLRSLEHLQLCDCYQLSSLPTSFGDLRNLQFLDLSNCYQLKTLPVSFKNLMLLQFLNLNWCTRLILRPEDFQNITKLEYANFGYCEQLQELPCHITNQASLRELRLYKTDSLRELPIDIGQLSMLQKVSIGSELLTTLPTSLENLSSLTNLSISDCSKLESLPTTLGNLSSLTDLLISHCSNLESLPTTLGNLSSLTDLLISCCSNLQSLPTTLGNLSSLKNLSISDCSNLKSLPTTFGNLSSLKNLSISDCSNLKSLPTALINLSSLTNLSISNCSNLESLPTTLRNSSSLTNLSISDCSNLESLPTTLRNSSSLTNLSIESCDRLDSLPSSLGDFPSLTNVTITSWRNPTCLPFSVERLRLLERLTIEGQGIKVEFGAVPLPFGSSNLKDITIGSVYLSRISMPEDRYPRLESLHLNSISYLREIEALPTTIKSIILSSCHMLEKIRVRRVLVNLECFMIDKCSMLAELPSFARSTSLRQFKLQGQNRIQKIEGLEYWTRLESLRVETCWEGQPGIQNLERMDTAIEPCIQRIQKCLVEKLSCYPRLETLFLVNSHLTEIEALPMAVKWIELASCRMLKNIRTTCNLVNLQVFKIKSCPMLAELPSFAFSTSLREFELEGCNGVQIIEGLECCTSLVSLRVETCSDVTVIESLEDMENLERVQLKANKGPAFEACIQTIKKFPDITIGICTRTVPEASSLVDSWLSQNLDIDSFSNHKLKSRPKLLMMRPSKGDELFMLCFVINCVTAQMELPVYYTVHYGEEFDFEAKVEKGRWAWVRVFRLLHGENEDSKINEVIEVKGYEEPEIEEESEEDEDNIGGGLEIEEEIEEDEDNIDFKDNEVERGLVVRGNQQRVLEAFHSLLHFLKAGKSEVSD